MHTSGVRRGSRLRRSRVQSTIESLEPRTVLTDVTLALLGAHGITIFGAESNDYSGSAVSSAGDVNGDGFDDLVIGAPRADATIDGKSHVGESYVIYGGASPGTTIDLANLGTAGITIFGGDRGDFSGSSVNSAGDVNGDGFDDLIIGALYADGPSNGRASAGESYVIFGGASLPAVIELANLGSSGVVIWGAGENDRSGTAVSGAGDVNGDGFDDLLVGAPQGSYVHEINPNPGKGYVIFGRATLPATIDLGNLDSDGITLLGGYAGDGMGFSVSGAGDVNGDGFGDLVIGVRTSNRFSTDTRPTHWLIFGGATLPTTIDLIDQNFDGIPIFNAQGGGRLTLDDAGDVNGDGFNDIIIGAPRSAGQSYVIFGGKALPAAIDLLNLGSAGITIIGIGSNDHIGNAVGGAGDVNGDGFDDLIIGASYINKSYLIFGKASLPATIEIRRLGLAGISILGIDALDDSGGAVSNAGDVNGDGFEDLIVGSRRGGAAANAKPTAGESYVILRGDFRFSTTHQGTTADDVLAGNGAANVMHGGLGNDTLIGNGGRDVIYGGEGSDTFTIADAAFQRIDGGHGVDTLRLDGIGTNLDLTSLADNRLRSIETIDLRASGANVLTLNALEVLTLTANSSATHAPNTLTVRREADDVIDKGAGWTRTSDSVIDGVTYNTFQNGAARLLLESLPMVINLGDLGAGGTTFLGIDSGDHSGRAVSNAGDVNGDGFDDLLVGAFGADGPNNDKRHAGESYVIFGGTSLPPTLDLANLGSAGITIFGADSSDYSGYTLSAAGDVNGDGFDDLIIGACFADALGNAKDRAGESYVIFGGTSLPATIDLASPGSAGVTIFGANAGTFSGYGVSSAGDLNGDGFDDLVVGARLASAAAGESYVIFGSTSLPATIDLANLGTVGITIQGASRGDFSGYSLSGAGDVNGDGFDDLCIGAFKGTRRSDANVEAGESYVVFGRASFPTTIDLSNLDSTGITIFGEDREDHSGFCISGAGDVNGDGFDDLLIGAYLADASGNAKDRAGESYLVFGGPLLPAAIDLANLGSAGTTIFGADVYDFSGIAVSGAGDVNGDGFDDLLIGAPFGDASDNTQTSTGETYVIFGRTSLPTTIDLTNLGSAGVTIFGTRFGDQSGRAVSNAGDVNGDGFHDVLIGAFAANKAFVIFGGNFTDSVTQMGTEADETLTGHPTPSVMIGGAGRDTLVSNTGADVIYAGEGNDILTISGTAFRRLDGGNGLDTLRLDGAGISLSLIALPDNKLTSIEAIDLRGDGANSLMLNLREVLNITSSSNSDRTVNTLTIRRDSDDSINMGSGWTQGADAEIGSVTYQTFTQGAATLRIEAPRPMSATLVNGQIIFVPPSNGAVDVLVTQDTSTQEIVVTAHTTDQVTAEFRFSIASVTAGLEATLELQNDRFDATLAGIPVTLNGGDGNDSLTGGSASDLLVGGSGNDTLMGRTGQDTLDAGSGESDLLSEAFDANVILTSSQLLVSSTAGTETDVLSGFDRALILGGWNANRLDASSSGIPVTMFGGNGNDVLIGSTGADRLEGQAGNDLLTGGDGSDSLMGGAGNDTVEEIFDQNIVLTNSIMRVSGNGRKSVLDKVSAIEFASVSGGLSRNKIDLSSFTDSLGATIQGNGNRDTIIGSPAPDTIITLNQPDLISGLGGADTVYSGGGNDTVSGGDGNDLLNGQNGNDLVTGDVGLDVLVGGAGRDTLNGGADGDFLSGQADPGLLNGGEGNDTLLGNTAMDTLNGDAGNDRLTGLQSDDLLSGGHGADTLLGGAGNDILKGGDGADDLRGEVGGDTIDGGADSDRVNEVFDRNVTIIGRVINTNGLGSDTTINVERINILGGPGDNFFDARAATIPVLLFGGVGNDTLLGGAKIDTINGGEGDDVLSGGGSNDLLDGDVGNDYAFEKSDAHFTVSGVTITAATSITTSSDTPINIERIVLIGGTGANKLDATLAGVPVVLIGGPGRDTLLGGSQADTLSGGNRDDSSVVGGDGVDSLNGGAGFNIIEHDASDRIQLGSDDEYIVDVFALLPAWVDAL